MLLIAAFLLGLAEIIIIPVSMALTSENAPRQYQTTMMGVYYFTLTFSGYLSGEIATLSPVQTHAAHSYSLFFASISLVTLLLTAIIYLLQKRLQTL
jgi:dipeptide/tripeptide permease